MILQKKIQTYRNETFGLSGNPVRAREQGVDFVNRRGFVFFWPIKGILLPNLWTAVAGARPVADAHDDPGHITWGWKDELLGGKAWYYAKVLRKRATMISFPVVPYFYALSENYGSPQDDYLTLYEQGKLTQEAKAVYEALLDEGPLDTLALRRVAQMTSRSSDSRFNRALADLQADFKILPVGVTQSGGWRYAFAYDIVARHYPQLPDRAHPIRENLARQELTRLYFSSVGAAQMRDVKKLFQWRQQDVARALSALVDAKVLCADQELEKQPGKWYVLAELC